MSVGFYEQLFVWVLPVCSHALLFLADVFSPDRYTPTPGVVAAVATVARVKAMQRLQDPYGINQSSRTHGKSWEYESII